MPIQTQEGAMIGGSFLPEQEFKEIIKEYFDDIENVKKIKNILNTILRFRDNPRIIYNNIEKLETELFKNPAVSLLVITNYTSNTGNYQWNFQSKESNVLTSGGAISYTKAIKKGLLEQQYAKILSAHLLDMIKTVENTSLTNQQINNHIDSGLFKSNTFPLTDLKENMGRRAHYNRKLSNIIYGSSTDVNIKGKIADAFLNHLGNMHRGIFSEGIQTLTPILQSVLEEEGMTGFLQLLIDSTNTTGWWTGGDLIVVSNNQVIANIQLKTILNSEKNGTGKITTDKVLAQVQKLRDFIDKDIIYNKERFADIMYSTFKTSAVFDKIDEQVSKDSIELIKQTLNLSKK